MECQLGCSPYKRLIEPRVSGGETAELTFQGINGRILLFRDGLLAQSGSLIYQQKDKNIYSLRSLTPGVDLIGDLSFHADVWILTLYNGQKTIEYLISWRQGRSYLEKTFEKLEIGEVPPERGETRFPQIRSKKFIIR